MHSITWTARRLKEAKLRDNHRMQLELHKGGYCIDFSSIPALFWKGTFPRWLALLDCVGGAIGRRSFL